jgi:hypothetical protein
MVSGSLHIFELNHRLHSSYEKSVVEGTIEYLKDGTGGFDDYYPCRRSGLGDIYVFANGWFFLLLCIIVLSNPIPNSLT